MQVLNLGLYAQDFNTMGRQFDGTRPNIINSVTEYVAEVVMNKHNAFPEKKERPNQSDHIPIFKFQPFKIMFGSNNRTFEEAASNQKNYNRFVTNNYINHTTDITSPPPKFFI